MRTHIITLILSLSLLYGSFAFIQMAWEPSSWHIALRIIFVVLTVLLVVAFFNSIKSKSDGKYGK